jgi:Domain of unknown function (DUF4383)
MNYDRGFAYTCGVILLAFGICGFIPAFLMPATSSPSDLGDSGAVISLLHGQLLHFFNVNVVLSSIYVIAGLAGLWMATQPLLARRYAQSVCIGYAGLAVLGCIPQTANLLGLAPIGGHDVGLHIFIASVAGTFGFIIRAEDWTTIGTHEEKGQGLDEMPSHMG